MIEATTAALSYDSRNFRALFHTAVPHHRVHGLTGVRAVRPEPDPDSEGIGFIARVRPDDRKGIELSVYVTAHDVANQCGGTRLIDGRSSGRRMWSKASRSTALLVMTNS